jgi:hypothetical protein
MQVKHPAACAASQEKSTGGGDSDGEKKQQVEVAIESNGSGGGEHDRLLSSTQVRQCCVAVFGVVSVVCLHFSLFALTLFQNCFAKLWSALTTHFIINLLTCILR